MLKNFRNFLCISLLLFPLRLQASFIEATMGTAVVNDATASYYNPSALTLLKNPQIVGLVSTPYFRTQFSGYTIQPTTGFAESGKANTRTHYFLPSGYVGLPVTNKMTVGLAIISNFFNKDFEGDSLLRYAQSGSRLKSIDYVPAVGVKFNDFFALGIGISFSRVDLLLKPIVGFPGLNVPDSQSRNSSSGSGTGGEIGLLITPAKATLIGLNYRSAVTYRLSGKSIVQGFPQVTSNHYYFKIWTPARSVLSINQFVSPNLGFIGTIQYIQFSIFKDINIHNIATRVGLRPVIVRRAQAHFHSHNSWLVTLGGHYRIKSKWVIRVAGSYIQSPANGRFQISTGDSFILGSSMGYEISKNIVVDGSYAHAFIKNKKIHIKNRSIIIGTNKGFRDAYSLKLTLNF